MVLSESHAFPLVCCETFTIPSYNGLTLFGTAYADRARSMQSYPRFRHRQPLIKVHQKLAQHLAHTRRQRRREPKRRSQYALAIVKVRANRDYCSASSQRYGHVPQTVAAARAVLHDQVSPGRGERPDDEVFVRRHASFPWPPLVCVFPATADARSWPKWAGCFRLARWRVAVVHQGQFFQEPDLRPKPNAFSFELLDALELRLEGG